VTRKATPASRLHGDDKRQSALRDTRGGTFDSDPPDQVDSENIRERRTTRQNAQPGADVRGETVSTPDTLPEGLRRERKGPLDKDSGRGPAKPTTGG
jgi:hypothetical protein